MIRILGRCGGWWIRSQQKVFRPRGRELATVELGLMKGFFQDALLAKVRIHRLEEGSRPPWFRVRRIAGITLADTIVLAPRAPAIGPAWSRLLFHELVHVVQFEMLGIDEFAARYLGAWMTRGLRYRRIPLEQHVRELERCFAARPSEPFDVETEVAQQLVDGR